MGTTADILRRFYSEVWEQGRTDAVERFFEPAPQDAVLVPEKSIEPYEVREWMEVLHLLVQDITVTFLHMIENGDWCAAYIKITCTSRKTGKPVKVHQQVMSRQVDGRLVESYPHLDLLRLFEQLDQLPEDAYPLLMGGFSLK